jgi:hypothetical protein
MVPVGGNALAPSWLLIYAAGSERGLLFFSASGQVVTLYMVSKLLGKPAGDETGQYIKYEYWKQGVGVMKNTLNTFLELKYLCYGFR